MSIEALAIWGTQCVPVLSRDIHHRSQGGPKWEGEAMMSYRPGQVTKTADVFLGIRYAIGVDRETR
jgi:hypothetical protein